jgi:uncharacterized protein YbjT (DUF2867 family)
MGAGSPRAVFITGGTGYIGSCLIAALLARGHRVRALLRPGSERKLRSSCEVVIGDALDADSFSARVAPADAFVQLVGVSKPSPWKSGQFRAVDRASALAGIEAAQAARVPHFVYVSVAQPAPVMQAYVHVRAECEARIREAGLVATIVRPWYVLGPGHRWPLALLPVYKVLEAIPSTRERAVRLGLVTLERMITTLVWAIENPPERTRVLETREIRAGRV